MAERISLQDIVVGERLGPVTYLPDADIVDMYRRDYDDRSPSYDPAVASGPALVPVGYMAGLACFHLLLTKYDALGTLSTQTEHRNLKPIEVGRTLSVTGAITGTFVKRGIDYIVLESEMVDDTGDLVRRSRDEIALGIERRELTMAEQED